MDAKADKATFGEIQLQLRDGMSIRGTKERYEVARNDGEVKEMIIGVGNGQFMVQSR